MINFFMNERTKVTYHYWHEIFLHTVRRQHLITHAKRSETKYNDYHSHRVLGMVIERVKTGSHFLKYNNIFKVILIKLLT